MTNLFDGMPMYKPTLPACTLLDLYALRERRPGAEVENTIKMYAVMLEARRVYARAIKRQQRELASCALHCEEAKLIVRFNIANIERRVADASWRDN